MPSGYTADVAEGKVTSLKEFALTCARAFGALIEMRDEPHDAPIPKQFEVDTSHYDEVINDAQVDLDRLLNSTPEELETLCLARNERVKEYSLERLRKNEDTRANYLSMIAKVEAWEDAPENMKEFMLQQLNDSLKYDVSDDPLKYCDTVMNVEEWVESETESLRRQIENYTEYREEEIARVKDRNEWLAKFHKSIENLD